MKKVLSVIIPAYNIEQYIEKCLESFLGFDNEIEVLLIDDGSSDQTSIIGKKYSLLYPNLIQYFCKENGGHGSTINMGMEKAKGKYFIVVDGDDWVDKKGLEQLVSKLNKLDVDLIITNYTRRLKDKKEIIEYKDVQYDKIYQFSELEIEKYYFVLASICYRKETLDKVKLELFEKTYYVDVQYILKPMIMVQNVVFLDINLYQYRIGREGQSISKLNMVKNYNDHKKVVLDMLEFYTIQKEQNMGRQLEYIKNIMLILLKDHYMILLQYDQNISRAKSRLCHLETLLEYQYTEIYEVLKKKIHFFKMIRGMNYNGLLLYRLLIKIKNNIKLGERK